MQRGRAAGPLAERSENRCAVTTAHILRSVLSVRFAIGSNCPVRSSPLPRLGSPKQLLDDLQIFLKQQNLGVSPINIYTEQLNLTYLFLLNDVIIWQISI